MSRRVKSKTQKRDWRWWASFALNMAVVLSMVGGSVILLAGGSFGQPAPIALPTSTVGPAAPTIAPAVTSPAAAQPTAPPSPPPPSPTPKASASDPTPSSTGALTFAVAGDSRDGEVIYKKLLDRVTRDGNAFLIHTGDLVSNGTRDEWIQFREIMQGFKLPFYPVPGNHDIRSGKLTDYLQYSGAPAQHYSFTRGPVHFTFIDSSPGSLLDSEFAFLDRDLSNSNSVVKMVFLHHPPFAPSGSSHIMSSGNDRFMQLMAQRRVQYVFAGHIHCYEEGERDGVKYYITGGAGAPITCLPVMGGVYHYIRVQVQGDQVQTQMISLESE